MQDPPKLVCEKCKSPLDHGLNSCSNCGAPLPDETLAETTLGRKSFDIAIGNIQVDECLEVADHLAQCHEQRYSIGAQIAEGGMGRILQVRDENVRRDVAMKVAIKTGQSYEDEIRLTRFVEEAQITGQLEHPNIVPVHELGMDDNGEAFYTMKMIRGVNLEQIIRSIRASDEDTIREYPLGQLINIFLKACDAVAFAHSRGVIHRDLKPANIMVGDYGEVLVLDWGLAKILGHDHKEPESPAWVTQPIESLRLDSGKVKTLDGLMLGTPMFMAPEQAEGEHATLTASADIYSLGAILYNILTLRYTIETSSLGELMVRLQTGRIPPPQSWNNDKDIELPHCPRGRIPDSVAAVAMKALSLRSEDRYTNVRAMQDDLVAWQQGYATEAEEASIWKHASLLIARHKRETVLAAAALCLLLAFATAFVVRLKKSRDKEEAQRVRAEHLLDVVNEEKENVTIAKLQAENERDTAERNEYLANVALASDYILRSGRPRSGLAILESCAPERRGFEWHFLHSRVLNASELFAVSTWPRNEDELNEDIRIEDDRILVLTEQPNAGTSLFAFTKKDETWHEERVDFTETVRILEAPPKADILLRGLQGQRWMLNPEDGSTRRMPDAKEGLQPICKDCKVLVEHALMGFAPKAPDTVVVRDLDSGEVLYQADDRTAYTGLLPHRIVLANVFSHKEELRVEVINCRGEKQFEFRRKVPMLRQVLDYRICISQDGTILAIVNVDGQLFFLDSATGHLINEYNLPFTMLWGAKGHRIILGPENRRVFITGSWERHQTALLWDLHFKRTVKEYEFRADILTSNETMLAAAESNRIRLINWQSGGIWREIYSHERPIAAMRFLDKDRLLSLSSGLIAISSRARPEKHYRFSWFTQEGRVVRISSSSPRIEDPVRGFIHHSYNWRPDSNNLKFHVRRTIDHKHKRISLDVYRGGKLQENVTPPSEWWTNESIAITRSTSTDSGRFLICKREKKEQLEIYDRKLKRWFDFKGIYPQRWYFSKWLTQDGLIPTRQGLRPLHDLGNAEQLLGTVFGQYFCRATPNSTYEIRRLDELDEVQFEVPFTDLRSFTDGRVACTADAKLAAFVVGQNNVALYDLKNGRHLKTIVGTRGMITGIGLWPDGSRIMLADRNDLLYFLEPQSGKELFRMALESRRGKLEDVMRFVVSPDEKSVMIITPGREHYLMSRN